MAHLIKLTLFAAPFTAHAYNVDQIARVEVIQSVAAVPGVPAHLSEGVQIPAVPSVPAIPEHARVIFTGMTSSSIEVKETQAWIMEKANA